MVDVWMIVPAVLVLYLFSSIKILREYERGVVFRLGRVLPQAKGPGIVLVFAPIDRLVRMSLRIEALEVPAQDVVTRDNVTVKVNAVIFFHVVDPRLVAPGPTHGLMGHEGHTGRGEAGRVGRANDSRHCPAG
jgi:regulator of protease activity HflC (stomatin/prohibitin superfamily)